MRTTPPIFSFILWLFWYYGSLSYAKLSHPPSHKQHRSLEITAESGISVPLQTDAHPLAYEVAVGPELLLDLCPKVMLRVGIDFLVHINRQDTGGGVTVFSSLEIPLGSFFSGGVMGSITHHVFPRDGVEINVGPLIRGRLKGFHNSLGIESIGLVTAMVLDYQGEPALSVEVESSRQPHMRFKVAAQVSWGLKNL